jgi:hypothetical protein
MPVAPFPLVSHVSRANIVFPHPVKTTTRQVRSRSGLCVTVFMRAAEKGKSAVDTRAYFRYRLLIALLEMGKHHTNH